MNTTITSKEQTTSVQNPIQTKQIEQIAEEETKRPEKAQYSEQVQNMIEQFNGRIIE